MWLWKVNSCVQDTKMAARGTQRSTSTIYGKIGDCEQFMVVSKISFGSLSVELVESFMETILMVSFPKKRMGICIRHWSCSSIPRLLAVCLILLSGYKIPGKYQLRKNEIYFQPNNIKKKNVKAYCKVQRLFYYTEGDNLLLERTTAIYFLQSATSVIT